MNKLTTFDTPISIQRITHFFLLPMLFWSCSELSSKGLEDPLVFEKISSEKVRTIILADMGNEPDEEQQMAHMLMYCNEFKLEGLIAVSGKYMNPDRDKGAHRNKLHPGLFKELIAEYAKVRDNLTQHGEDWPEADYLYSIVKSGTLEYGISGVGPGKATEGSKLILNSIKDNLAKGKLFFVVNAGSNTLAQALFDLRNDETISQADKAIMIKNIYAYENGAQDNSGAWITKNFPAITWYRSNHQTYAYGGAKNRRKNQPQGPYCWEPFPRSPQGQHEWSATHIQNNHGALGERFPDRVGGTATMEGGGTSPWIGLVNHGLTNPWSMWWGGWGGRFSKEKHKNVSSRHPQVVRGADFQGAKLIPSEMLFHDFYVYEADSEVEIWTDPVHGETFTDLKVPVWRFRRPMWNDFRARMDWCVKSYENANHNPIAFLNGDGSDDILVTEAKPGIIVKLSAKRSTDPDNDSLTYRWWSYKEAGTYSGDITIDNGSKETIEVMVPKDASEGDEIHIILEIRDHESEKGSEEPEGFVPLTDYRRLIIKVRDKDVK